MTRGKRGKGCPVPTGVFAAICRNDSFIHQQQIKQNRPIKYTTNEKLTNKKIYINLHVIIV